MEREGRERGELSLGELQGELARAGGGAVCCSWKDSNALILWVLVFPHFSVWFPY